MHALAAGTAIAARHGRPTARRLPTRCRRASRWRAASTYPGNTEFGEPADADASDDFIVRHEQFTASYNPNRGTPELGELRPRRRALRRRRPLRLLHDGSGPAGHVPAHHDRRLHRRRRVPRLRHRPRPHGALVRSHHGQPRQRAHLSVQQRRAAGGRHEPGAVGESRERSRRSRARAGPRGVHHHRRGR